MLPAMYLPDSRGGSRASRASNNPYKTNGIEHMALSGPILDPHIARDVPHMSPDDLPDGSNDSQMGPNVLEVTPT